MTADSLEKPAALPPASADQAPDNAMAAIGTQKASPGGEAAEVPTLRLSILALALGIALASAVATVVSLLLLRQRQALMAASYTA